MDNPLLQATSEEEVNRLVAEGYPVNGFTIEPDSVGEYDEDLNREDNVPQEESPLYRAIVNRNVEVVRALLDNGASPNVSLWTAGRRRHQEYYHSEKPLFLAITNQAPLIIIRYLVEAGARLAYGGKRNALYFSFKVGDEEFVDYFMREQGMEVRNEYLVNAIKSENPDFLDYLFSNRFPVIFDINADKGTAFYVALLSKDIHIVDRLIIAGANPTIYVSTSPLGIACRKNFYEAIVRLIDTWPDIVEFRSHHNGKIASFDAIGMENLDMVRYVLERSDLGSLDDDGNCLMHSAFEWLSHSREENLQIREEMIRMVIELANRQEEGLGARLLEAPNKKGESPLLNYGILYKEVNTLRFLHELGVNFTAVSDSGKNIYHYVLETRGNIGPTLTFLAEIFPEGLSQADGRGRTPLMLAEERNTPVAPFLRRLMGI